MTAPAYTTDLTSGVISEAESSTGWTEPTGFTAGTLAAETDYFIQSPGSGTTHCISKSMGASAPASSGSIFDSGGGKTIPSPGAFMTWLFFGAPNALAVQISGGMQVFCGSSGANFQQWYVRGSDTYPYGGWICVPVDPAVAQSTQTGTPSGTKQFFGAAAYIPTIAVSKGSPFGVDVIRYGRCEARIAYGATADGYATFAGFVATNDTVANRWGLLQSVQGGYLMQGLIILGYVNACDFRDANRNIFIANTEKVISSFNAIEVRQATSRVDMTAISITALGTTSRGNWITTDNADINKDGCVFTDMGTFSYKSNSTILNSVYRRCDQITQGGATFTGCTIDNSTAATAMVITDINAVTNSKFISDGTGYALEAFGVSGSYTMTGLTFTGYAAGVSGTSGNEAVHVKATTGVVSITANACSSFSYRTDGATVNITFDQKSVNITGLVSGTEIHLYKTSDLTELSGIESSGASWTYSYTPDDAAVFITLIKPGYKWVRYDGLTLSSSGISIIATQQADLGYSNP